VNALGCSGTVALEFRVRCLQPLDHLSAAQNSAFFVIGPAAHSANKHSPWTNPGPNRPNGRFERGVLPALEYLRQERACYPRRRSLRVRDGMAVNPKGHGRVGVAQPRADGRDRNPSACSSSVACVCRRSWKRSPPRPRSVRCTTSCRSRSPSNSTSKPSSVRCNSMRDDGDIFVNSNTVFARLPYR